LSGGGKVRAFTDLLGRLGSRRHPDGEAPEQRDVPADAQHLTFPTKALRKLLGGLKGSSSPVLLDLGPVIGQNLAFFGEELGCKVHIEDLFADLDRHVRTGSLDTFPEFLSKRFSQADASIDGILCWDLIDYLQPRAASVLARELTRMLAADGSLLGFFGNATLEEPHFTKYIVHDEENLRHKTYPAALLPRRTLANRDIIRLFDGLRVSDSFLLRNNVREILFKKPAYLSSR
jgi:hypothetical protein